MQAELREKSWGSEPLCVVKVLQVDSVFIFHSTEKLTCYWLITPGIKIQGY